MMNLVVDERYRANHTSEAYCPSCDKEPLKCDREQKSDRQIQQPASKRNCRQDHQQGNQSQHSVFQAIELFAEILNHGCSKPACANLMT